MSVELDRQRIEEIVQAVADRLPGDWLLIGGALVALWIEPRRVTEDVDLVGIRGTGAERFDLLALAQELGLPVEALNSAADFFVERIAGWTSETELFRAGARGRVLRPSPTLLLLLKIGRLSARDLDDCLALLALVKRDLLPIDVPRVLAALAALPATADGEVADRRARLQLALQGLVPPGDVV